MVVKCSRCPYQAGMDVHKTLLSTSVGSIAQAADSLPLVEAELVDPGNICEDTEAILPAEVKALEIV